MDELKERCRACSQGCIYPSECSYFDKPPLRCMRQLLSEAADAIEELQATVEGYESSTNIVFVEKDGETVIEFVPRWIPVTERLPEHEYGESTSVLTVDLYGVMRVTYFDGGNWCWPSGEALTTMRVAPITYWMPLPPAPKEEE